MAYLGAPRVLQRIEVRAAVVRAYRPSSALDMTMLVGMKPDFS